MKHYVVAARLSQAHAIRLIGVEAYSAEEAAEKVFNLFLGQYKIVDVKGGN